MLQYVCQFGSVQASNCFFCKSSSLCLSIIFTPFTLSLIVCFSFPSDCYILRWISLLTISAFCLGMLCEKRGQAQFLSSSESEFHFWSVFPSAFFLSVKHLPFLRHLFFLRAVLYSINCVLKKAWCILLGFTYKDIKQGNGCGEFRCEGYEKGVLWCVISNYRWANFSLFFFSVHLAFEDLVRRWALSLRRRDELWDRAADRRQRLSTRTQTLCALG